MRWLKLVPMASHLWGNTGWGLPHIHHAAARHRILVVDDEESIRALLVATLRPIPHATLIEAHGGIEALAAVEQHPPDLIVTDIEMPDGDGVGLCMALRSSPAWRRIPVVVVSGVVDSDERVRRLAQLPAVVLRSKPFDVADLQSTVTTLLGAVASERRGDAWHLPASPSTSRHGVAAVRVWAAREVAAGNSIELHAGARSPDLCSDVENHLRDAILVLQTLPGALNDRAAVRQVEFVLDTITDTLEMVHDGHDRREV